MESKDEIRKESSSMIFRLSMGSPAQDAEKKLRQNSSVSKGAWLIRESSVPGLLTISYYSQSRKGYLHQRIGFVGDTWQAGPADREGAKTFAQKAKAAFQGGLPDGSEEKLYDYLQEAEFDVNDQLLPNPDEASERYAAYCIGRYGEFVTDTDFVTDEETSSSMGFG